MNNFFENKVLSVDLIEENAGQVSGVPANPRKISKEKLKQLIDSIDNAREMLELRELLVYPLAIDRYVAIGGNMRLRALKELDVETVPCKIISTNVPAEKLREYAIKDNIVAGEWDSDILKNWDVDEVINFNSDFESLLSKDDDEIINFEKYSQKVSGLVYEITGENPAIDDLTESSLSDSLIEEISKSDIPEEVKTFLKIASYRHVKFNFAKIAEFYAHADKKVQELFEKNALVIVDMDKAIENGYFKMSQELEGFFNAENDDE